MSALLACLLGGLLSCGHWQSEKGPLTAASQSAISGSHSVASPTQMGSRLLEQLTADLDNDGDPELVTARQDGELVTVSIAPQNGGRHWQAKLPPGVAVVSVRAQDVNADSLPEVLVETRGPDDCSFGLGVIRWTDGQGKFLGPEGSRPTGDDYFCSVHYPPWIVDLDNDSVLEITVSVAGSNPRFLDSVAYMWINGAYRKTHLYLLPPRPVPSPTPS